MLKARRDPDELVKQVVFFWMILEQRGDLPVKYHQPFVEMIAQIRKNIPKLAEVRRLLEGRKECLSSKS